MNKVVALLLLITSSCVVSAPLNDDEKIHIDNEFFPEQQVIYTAEHDIVSLYVPLNSLNFNESEDCEHTVLFFALADEDENGHRIDQGLYVLREAKATKLLDFGRDSTADSEDNNLAYFAAKDGIYSYDFDNNKAVKYGTVTDNIIKIAKANGTDIIYIINEDHQVFKVTEEGTVKSEIHLDDRFTELALDLSNHLYLLTEKSELVVIDDEGNKILIDIPSDGQPKTLVRPAFVQEDSIVCVVGKNVYVAYANGTYEDSEFILEVTPTAYAPDATLIQYYALNKKIYEYNILAIMLEGLFGLETYFEDKKDEIQSIATRSRSDMRP